MSLREGVTGGRPEHAPAMKTGELLERLLRLRDRTDERVDRDALAIAINRLTAIEAAVDNELGMAPRHDLDQGMLDFAQTIRDVLDGKSS